MRQRRFLVLVATATVTLAACGSSGGSDSEAGSATVDGNVVAVGSAQMPGGGGGGGIGDAIEVAAAAPGEASDVACTVDRQTLELAIQSYEILNGALPKSQQDLLDAQMISELSVRFEISGDGTVVPAPGSPCT